MIKPTKMSREIKQATIKKILELFVEQKQVSIIADLPEHIDGGEKKSKGGLHHYPFINEFNKVKEFEELILKIKGDIYISKLNEEEYKKYAKEKGDKIKDLDRILEDIAIKIEI